MKNEMLTRKDVQNSMKRATLKAMFTTRLLLDKKIIIPAIFLAIGGFALYFQPPQTKFGEIGSTTYVGYHRILRRSNW